MNDRFRQLSQALQGSSSRGLVIIVAAAASMTACSTSTAPRQIAAAQVHTNAESVPVEQTQFGRRVSIPFTITNTGTRTLYYFPCGFAAVEKLVAGAWARACLPTRCLVVT